MGSPKAELDWHGSTLLRRVTGILARALAGPVVVVAAPGQPLPALGPRVEGVVDELEGRGPLQGLVGGLAAVAERSSLAYVSAVDVPLLHPEFVRAVVGAVGSEVDVAVPDVDGRAHPLAAAYRVSVLPVAEALLSEHRRALRALLEACRVRLLAGAELPALESLGNLNTPADYERARALPAPEVRVDGSPARAWRLGEVLRGGGAPKLNGEPVEPDPELPLVAGDEVTF
jgi:molybdopterin-guanine dinucleotide biosynthesis protein A